MKILNSVPDGLLSPMSASPSAYRAKLFEERGLIRLKCRVCGSYFWSLAERETCGDAPCTPYEFLMNPIRANVSSLTDVRERFLRFFERHGHSRVRRYPVVANRWRDDVYLVGASIFVFQPWVTEGIVEPPANPLVISQPCIRLTDVDVVGRSGRHLTGFEMMAHHAFNYPDKHVYWMNETVELAHKFFTEELGVPESDIVYKESWWEGGGNAGECFEVLVRGLEVATLVFMRYRKVGERYESMRLRVVDTGYGLERIYWLCTGSPSIYDAVFGQYIDDVRRAIGLERRDEKLVKLLIFELSKLRAEDVVRQYVVAGIARRLELSADELNRLILELEFLYSLADHSRTLTWMICDGVIPSNSGIGYLARLLVRRILKQMTMLGVDRSLSDLLSMHLKYLAREYPEVKEYEGVIERIADLEQRRFRESISRSLDAVLKIIRRSGKRELSADDLVTLYDSHGIPPEVVSTVCRQRLGVDVKVPENFYALLAQRHSVVEPRGAERKEFRLGDVLKGLPRTHELFYENPYLTRFRAKVLRVIDGKYVVLDQTCFYPEGGGQPCDLGYIRYNGETCKVTDVQMVGDVILHKVEECKLVEGAEVEGEIDWSRRYSLMKMHTGTHILLQSIRRVLGPHVWQAGAQKDVPHSRLDVTHYELPSHDEIVKIEEIANKIVQSNMDVKTELLARADAESRYSFRIYQGGFVPSSTIRIVKIESDGETFDVQACAGTHVNKTGEIGLIKIVKVEKIQEGVIRFIFTTGDHAVRYVQMLDECLTSVAREVGCSKDEVLTRVRGLMSILRRYELRVRELERRVVMSEAERCLSRALSVNDVLVTYAMFDGEGESIVKELAEEITMKRKAVLIVLNRSGRGFDCRVYVSPEVAKVITARDVLSIIVESKRGGGGPTYAQGFIEAERIDVSKIVEDVVSKVRSRLRQ